MARRFTEDDRGKPVVTDSGRTIGTVSAVEQDRATVERTDDHASLTEEVKDVLGWDEDDDVHELRYEHVDEDADNQLYVKPLR